MINLEKKKRSYLGTLDYSLEEWEEERRAYGTQVLYRLDFTSSNCEVFWRGFPAIFDNFQLHFGIVLTILFVHIVEIVDTYRYLIGSEKIYSGKNWGKMSSAKITSIVRIVRFAPWMRSWTRDLHIPQWPFHLHLRGWNSSNN